MSDLVIVLLHSQQTNIFSISHFSHIKVKFIKICKESHYLTKVNKNTLSKNTLNKTSKAFGASCEQSQCIFYNTKCHHQQDKVWLNCIKIF